MGGHLCLGNHQDFEDLDKQAARHTEIRHTWVRAGRILVGQEIDWFESINFRVIKKWCENREVCGWRLPGGGGTVVLF